MSDLMSKIPRRGLTTTDLARIWRVPVRTASAWLYARKGVLVYRAWSHGQRVWRRIE